MKLNILLLYLRHSFRPYWHAVLRKKGNEIKTQEIIAYTSGLGGLFKPGIPVGKIFKDSVNKINFFSDFRQLEYVKIISHSIEGNN